MSSLVGGGGGWGGALPAACLRRLGFRRGRERTEHQPADAPGSPPQRLDCMDLEGGTSETHAPKASYDTQGSDVTTGGIVTVTSPAVKARNLRKPPLIYPPLTGSAKVLRRPFVGTRFPRTASRQNVSACFFLLPPPNGSTPTTSPPSQGGAVG